jgi:hypothetical protein
MYPFYLDSKYKQKQADLSKKNWEKGLYTSLITPLETRTCKNKLCNNIFSVKPWDHKKYCSRHCSVTVNNASRIYSEETKRKLSLAARNYNNLLQGSKKVARVIKTCLHCKKEFKVLPYLAKRRKFCSNTCAIYIIGRLTTSPKASKGKSGIRFDIDPNICFYSTWEANIARVFTLVGIEWLYAPTIFDLGAHTYRPDFYLPNDDIYIEIKNFMGTYSLQRDTLFREIFFHRKLEVIGKEEYKEIAYHYQPLIDTWEK